VGIVGRFPVVTDNRPSPPTRRAKFRRRRSRVLVQADVRGSCRRKTCSDFNDSARKLRYAARQRKRLAVIPIKITARTAMIMRSRSVNLRWRASSIAGLRGSLSFVIRSCPTSQSAYYAFHGIDFIAASRAVNPDRVERTTQALPQILASSEGPPFHSASATLCPLHLSEIPSDLRPHSRVL
jgi:hypothetical protein